MPTSPGAPDEFEDVILADDGCVVLFSAKASLIPMEVAKAGASRTEVLAWYERFFFAAKDKTNKQHSAAGAITLLNEKVLRIRAGDSPFDAKTEIIPVIVTYDEMVIQSNVYLWLDEICERDEMLKQPGVSPITIASIVEYEQLMALASQGRSAISLLRKKNVGSNRLKKLDWFLYGEVGGARHLLRFKELADEFDAFTQRMKTKYRT